MVLLMRTLSGTCDARQINRIFTRGDQCFDEVWFVGPEPDIALIAGHGEGQRGAPSSGSDDCDWRLHAS